MSYDFSFDKKSAILIVIGCAVVSILLFVAGFIVGLDKGQSQLVVQASAAAPGKPEPKSALAGAASEKPTAEQQKPSAATLEKPASEKSKETPAPANAENKSSGPAQDANPSSPQEADAKDKDKDKDKPGFSLQLGAFQTEENALKLRDNLKSKGYAVFLFRVMDGEGHLWHTVRMGHFADMKEASHAAVKVTGKEQISAWVRPSNAF